MEEMTDNNIYKNPLAPRILELHDEGFDNCEICEALSLSPGSVAGIIWRHNNPGIYKKNTPNSKRPYRKH